MALLAFAIACNGGSAVFITVPCITTITTTTPIMANSTPNNPTNVVPTLANQLRYKASYGYPYDLSSASLNPDGTCNQNQVPQKLDQGTITTSTYNIVSSAQFFVFVGVMSFLYSIAFTIIYVFFRHKYNNIVYIPLIV